MIKIFFVLVAEILIIACEQTIYIGPPDEEAAQDRKVFIRSKPTHAAIYLNGKTLGIYTPDTLKWLPTDNSTITLKLPMYADTSFNVTAFAGEPQNIFIDFSTNSKNVGNIYCESDPSGTDIWLNDSLLNRKTPTTLSRLTPGMYKVKFTSSYCRPDSTTVGVTAGKTEFIFLTLEDTSKWVSYNKSNSGIVSNYITALACDLENHIWAGTERGLMSFSGRKFETYTKLNSPLPNDIITCIAVDSQNRKWIGTASGLMVFDRNIWINYTTNLPSAYVTAIAFDKSGNGWIGTPNGFVRYSNGNWTLFNTSNSGLGDNLVTCFAFDHANNVWVGTAHNGINIYDGKSWKYFNTQNIGLLYDRLDYAQSIAIDNSGFVWVSSLNMYMNTSVILLYDGAKWTRYNYPSNLTYSILAKDQFVIFGNQKSMGILNNDNGSNRIVSKANKELTLFKVQAVMMDNLKNIWVGTSDYGLGKLKAGNF